ncbi:S41 family peptidase [Paenibacillus sp. OV219]|uniref:S41 family peptidase n=1 Tax=Paenibacillus sp. OV219 TaxID=1884377 RepID=UPI0008AAD21A|nr:S41 family peptidase [Paenibacillus sp. OV219]SEN84708.1 carboxyl-terminal processing protease [Paenibacillus sp. OV219]
MSVYGEQAVKQRRKVTLAIVLVIAVTVGFAGGRISMLIQYPVMKEAAFKNLSYAYNEIMNQYLNGAEAKALVDGAAEGMVASLGDPYSVYMTGEKGEQFVQSYEDHFVGIGVEIREEDGEFIIDKIIKGTPADRSELKAGDTFVTIEGKRTSGIELADLKALLQGEEGTKVKVSVSREGTEGTVDMTIPRGAVPVLTVAYEMKQGGIGEITISRFAEKTADEFAAAIAALQKKGMKSLLLDLRGNPGGLLEPTISIANRFVPKGQTIVQVVYKDEKHVITHNSSQKEPWKLPIAILVDAHTASSAEVLTAALKEDAGAQVVGEKTFGKGIVQNFRQLKDGSVLKLTEAQWRTPKGSWIHKKGIDPTVAVAAPDYAMLPRLPVGLKLKAGDYGDQVVTVQKMLQVLSYNVGTSLGIYNADTENAVRAFQSNEKLSVTGVVNDKTAYHMVSRLSDQFNVEDPQRNKAMALLQAAMK